MTVTVTYRYDNASADDLYALLTDEAFLRAKYEALGAQNLIFTEIGEDEDCFRVEWQRNVKLNPPAFAAGLLGSRTDLSEIIEWEPADGGGYRADYLCQVKGVPGELRGEFEIRPEGAGCVEVIHMSAKINIPLLGKKVAGFVEGDAEHNLNDEDAFTRRYLENR